MNIAAVVALFILSLFMIQDAPKKPAQHPSSDVQNKILKLQLQATRIQAQFQSCQQTDFQGQFDQVTAGMVALADQALVEAKLDKKGWELNLDTFEFQKRAMPTAPEATAPIPEKKP